MPKRIQAASSPVSERSTKSDILDAYNALLSGIEGKEEVSDKVVEEQKLVDKASQETVEKIVTDLSHVRLSANQTISDLTDKLTQESERLANLRKAISIAQKELEDTQKVKIKAVQLYGLIEAQKRIEEQFNQEMTEKRNAWEEEQKSYADSIKKERTRDEEEYEYNKKMVRKRDTEMWEEEKRKHAQQQAEERKAHEAMVSELEELRNKAAAFPAELDREIKAKVTEAVTRVQREAQIQQTLAKQEADSKQKLADQKIASLESMLTSHIQEIKELKQQFEKATNNIKDIAVSVVEGRKEANIQPRISSPESTK